MRVPTADPASGVAVFRGYLHGGQLVGSWRTRTDDVRTVPYEGPFVVRKVA